MITTPARFLALAIALRYEAEPDAPFLRRPACCWTSATARRAEVLGMALRLAYTLSAGTPDLLAGHRDCAVDGRRLVLRLARGSGVFAGESVLRRLDRLAQEMGLQATPAAARDEAA